MPEIINRVASSPLITIDIKEHLIEGERIILDLKDWLFQELMLREKDFRQQLKEHDWSQYIGKHVALQCSADAIIPSWAYMLMVTKLTGTAESVVFGSLDDLERHLYGKSFDAIDFSEFDNKKVVLKGCSDIPIPEYAFAEMTGRLQRVVSSIMYGEPCSTVPVWKSPKKRI